MTSKTSKMPSSETQTSTYLPLKELGESEANCNKGIPNKSGISWFVASFLIINTCVGTGILEMPWAYNAAGGLLPASIMHYSVLLVMVGSLVFLTYIAAEAKAESYQDVMMFALGPCGHKASILALTVHGGACCVMYMIITGDHSEMVLDCIVPKEVRGSWFLNQKLLVSVASVLVLYPLCLLREVKCLKYISVPGIVFVLYVIALVTVKYALYVSNPQLPQSFRSPPRATVVDVFLVAPGVLFAYACHYDIVTVYGAMTDNSIASYVKTLVATVVVTALFNSFVPIFGFLTFGSAVHKEIIDSYPPTPEVVLAYLLMALKCSTAFPLVFFVLRNGLQDLWTTCRKLSEEEVVQHEKKHRLVIGSGAFFSILLLYVAIPDVVGGMALSGGVTIITTCILPGLALMQFSLINQENMTDFRRRCLVLTGIFYISFGTFFVGVISVQAFTR